jgi:hypothetical protein
MGDMVAYSHPSMCTFETIGVIWSIILYYEETV